MIHFFTANIPDLYIGLRRQVTNDPYYRYEVSGVQVTSTDSSIFVPSPSNSNSILQAVALAIELEGQWRRVSSGANTRGTPTETLGSICQFDLI